MKLSKFIILILFTSVSILKVNAQKKEAIKITYKAINNLDLIATSTDELFILNDHTKSYYLKGFFSYKRSKHLPDGDFKFRNSKGLKYIYITDYASKRINSKEDILDEFLYFSEPIPEFNWKLIDEFKTINGINLQKTTTTFRGRNYIAWCDLNTPISQGPWKFNNLPGLAYEISDDALDFNYEWHLIKVSEAKEYDFSLYDFSKEKTISQQEYIKKMDRAYEINDDISMTRIPESLDIEILGVTHHKIDYRIRDKEKIYEWEE